MKLYAPKYYKDFACIADRCRHSCCVGWEIDIDGDTMKKYESLTANYGETIRDSIDTKDVPHFRLCADERCPHLDGEGLCRIIKNLGEDYLCCICREHPRFYNDTPRGIEAGLGLSCEEAARIILSSDGYRAIDEIGETDEELEVFGFDPLTIRGRLYSVLSDRSIPYTDRLLQIYSEFDTSPSHLTDLEWRELLSSLEYLDPSHQCLFRSYTSDVSTPRELEKPLERALAYFIYRHLSAARDEAELRAALGLSLFCERLLCALAKKDPAADICDLARILSEELEYSEENTQALMLEFWS